MKLKIDADFFKYALHCNEFTQSLLGLLGVQDLTGIVSIHLDLEVVAARNVMSDIKEEDLKSTIRALIGLDAAEVDALDVIEANLETGTLQNNQGSGVCSESCAMYVGFSVDRCLLVQVPTTCRTRSKAFSLDKLYPIDNNQLGFSGVADPVLRVTCRQNDLSDLHKHH